MIYNIVELIQLTDMAILRLLRNHNQRLIINKMLGLKSQIKGQLRYEFVIYMDELVIQKHPDGKTVCLAGDQVPARRTASQTTPRLPVHLAPNCRCSGSVRQERGVV